MSDADDLLANYKKAYDNRVGFGSRPALLLIDFCQAYFEPGNALYAEVEEAIASALRIRAAGGAMGSPTSTAIGSARASGFCGAPNARRTPCRARWSTPKKRWPGWLMTPWRPASPSRPGRPWQA